MPAGVDTYILLVGILDLIWYERKPPMSFQQPRNVQAVIRVIGVGGGGSNAIDRMIEDGVQDVTFVAINTDAQVLRNSKADYRICIGERLTRGMGAGGDPTVGEKAAEETNDELYEILKGTDMVFITAGMGGGTGTGAAPIVASIAQDLGILTVAVVTKPFKFEGNKRLQQAERGLEQLRKYVDALVVVPNDRLVEAYAKRGISILQGFQIVDSVLRQGIQGVADLITKTGMVNVDFADVKTVLANSGEALMSIGTGAGENRIQQAIEAAMSSPLLDVEIRGAKRILLNITSNENIKLTEIAEAANTIEAIVDPDANIIWGSVIDPNFPADQVKITLVATGISNFRQKTQLPSRQATREPEKRVAPESPQPKAPSSDSRDVRDQRPIRPASATPPPPLPAANPPRSGSPLAGGRRGDDSAQRPYEENPNIMIPPGLRDDLRRKN
jgi:cell division protein FtsZ